MAQYNHYPTKVASTTLLQTCYKIVLILLGCITKDGGVDRKVKMLPTDRPTEFWDAFCLEPQ